MTDRPDLAVVEGARGRLRLGPAYELIGLGIALTFTCVLLAALPSWRASLGTFQALAAVAFALYGLAVARMSRFARLPHVGASVFAVALATRAALLPVSPTLSDDLYRYVWEGKVVAHGRDPYRAAPADPALAELRDATIQPHVNHPDLAAIYPPLALAGFALVARISPTLVAMKTWIALHDLALILVLMAWLARAGASRALALVYAWNPLVLIEYAGSGHHEPTALVWLALAFLLARRRPLLSAVSLAAAALVKLLPLVALPSLLVRWPWRARIAALALLVPGLGFYLRETHVAQSGLHAYWSSWRNNEFVFHGLERLTGDFGLARTIALGIVAIAIAAGLVLRWAPWRATQLALRAGLLVTPVLHPWYLGWVLMLEPFTRAVPWLVGSATVLLAYGLGAPPREGGAFHLPLAWRFVEYGIPVVAGLVALAWPRRPREARLHVS